jgi:hypothetical protein
VPTSTPYRKTRSPSVNIPRVDHPDFVIDGMDDGMDNLEMFDFGPPVGSHSVVWGLKDLVSRRLPSARPRRAFSEGDVPINFTTPGS